MKVFVVSVAKTELLCCSFFSLNKGSRVEAAFLKSLLCLLQP